MADIVSTKAAAQLAETVPVVRPPFGSVFVEHETVEVGSIQSLNDTIDFFYIPGDAIIVGGHLLADDLDTGAETLEIDVGYTASGGIATADPDALINSGVLTGDELVVGGVAGNFRPLNGLMVTGGAISLGGDIGGKALIQGVVTAAANATGTGTITLSVMYKVP